MTAMNEVYKFSQGLADAAETAGSSTVLVNARRRIPATGISFAPELILTADHVVERDEEISILTQDGTEISVQVAGRDPNSDLAVLRLAESSGIEAIRTTGLPRVGELVLALGRPSLSGLQASLGIVTAIGGYVHGPRRRGVTSKAISADLFISTDAIPYPGFSGGPLINAAGEMVGLNTSGLGRGRSLSIPAERALSIGSILAEKGSVRRGYLGIRSQLTPLSPDRQANLGRDQGAGLLVVWVETGSAADASGVLVGDILTQIDGEIVEDHDVLQSVLLGDTVGRTVEVEVLRGDRPVKLSVTIKERQA